MLPGWRIAGERTVRPTARGRRFGTAENTRTSKHKVHSNAQLSLCAVLVVSQMTMRGFGAADGGQEREEN